MEPDSYSDIGTLLRSARQEMHLTLREAAGMLHIRARYLEALEEGNLSQIPGLTYTKGYLQSYAAFLGLDKEEILRRFEEVEALLTRRGFYFPRVFSKDKTPGGFSVWGSLALALAVYTVWAVAQPARVPISMVEPFPAKNMEKTPVSAAILKDVTCLQPQDGYYPPCTFAAEYGFNLLLLQGRIYSIMELANIH